MANNYTCNLWSRMAWVKKLEVGSWKFSRIYVDWLFWNVEDCMATVAIITVCTILCIAVGIPIGIVMARSNRAEKAILPF